MRVVFNRNLFTDLMTAKPARRCNEQSWLTHSYWTPKYFKSCLFKRFIVNDCACLEHAASGRKKYLGKRIKIQFPKWEN